jgi:CheY-like chemotaxis protein
MMRVQVIREGEHQVAVPIVDLVSTYAVSYDDIVEVPGGRAVRVGPRTLSVYSAHLSAGPAGGNGDVQAQEREGILIEIAGRDGGILVDDVLYSQYLPVRPAPTYLRRSCGLLGYALGVGGVIMPILDVETILAHAAPSAPLLRLDEARSARTLPQHTILVVDDSQTVRRALSQTFSRAGFLVREAHNGREALTAIRREMPDLITLDMEMPGMDGLETLSALRLLPGGASVPVFMITSRQQARHRAAAIAAGVTRYFTKPYDDDELVGAARLDLAARASSEVAS